MGRSWSAQSPRVERGKIKSYQGETSIPKEFERGSAEVFGNQEGFLRGVFQGAALQVFKGEQAFTGELEAGVPGLCPRGQLLVHGVAPWVDRFMVEVPVMASTAFACPRGRTLPCREAWY